MLEKICKKIEIYVLTLADFFMLAKKGSIAQIDFYSTFEEQPNHSHPLYILANQINWKVFEEGLQTYIQKKGVLQNKFD